jgi:hypothetical protein
MHFGDISRFHTSTRRAAMVRFEWWHASAPDGAFISGHCCLLALLAASAAASCIRACSGQADACACTRSFHLCPRKSNGHSVRMSTTIFSCSQPCMLRTASDPLGKCTAHHALDKRGARRLPSTSFVLASQPHRSRTSLRCSAGLTPRHDNQPSSPKDVSPRPCHGLLTACFQPLRCLPLDEQSASSS